MGSSKLLLPVEPYEVKGYKFGERVRSRVILWARHLGDDIVASEGTLVNSIGAGKVVWSEIRKGSAKKRNWGGLVIIEHATTQNPTFYSLYGHLNNLQVKTGEAVEMGQMIGAVADSETPENGWWKIAHLHFGIYTGPWTGQILPGYKRPFDGRTKFKNWRDPKPFIDEHNQE